MTHPFGFVKAPIPEIWDLQAKTGDSHGAQPPTAAVAVLGYISRVDNVATLLADCHNRGAQCRVQEAGVPRIRPLKGRMWLLVGIAVGVAVGVGKLAYFAGAARSLSDTAQRIVGSGGHTLVRSAASHGASLRLIDGVTALLAVLVPGVTALLLIFAARTTLHLRALVALVMAALGVAAFFYLPHGVAAGVAVLAFAAAGIAVVATGPLVAAPLAALAALIATGFLPRNPREPQHASQCPRRRLARGDLRDCRLAAVAASRRPDPCRASLHRCRAAGRALIR